MAEKEAKKTVRKPRREGGREKSEGFCLALTLIILAVFDCLYFYFLLPPINIHSKAFWLWILINLVIFTILHNVLRDIFITSRKIVQVVGLKDMSRPSYYTLIAAVIVIFIVFIGSICGSKIFRARTYAGLISVSERNFEEDMPETTEITNIALMDTASAMVLGKRALGNLSEVVSQFELSEQYSQINYKGSPQKVANLEYNGFFKWINNKNDGVPGYVMVDPVKNTAKYIRLEKGLKYVESGFFGDYLNRKLRFSYPTKIFGDCYFEIDDEGKPYYIISCMGINAGLFGAKDVSEVIIFDPVDGSSEIYDVGSVPAWVDIVYTGDLASKKYNWYGKLSGGFWNSIIGQKGCRVTTDDYGYLMFDDDVWYYTGVTSVLSDESNIGFILTNARTGEYRYYSIVGAEEYSAMSAAQGEVQEKGYTASFPSLINVADQASYIMVLKDKSGLVKLYALVNVENYSFVATGETQAKAIASYKRLLMDNGVIPDDTEVIEIVEDDVEEEKLEGIYVTAESIRFADISGSSWIYIKSEKGVLYKAKVADDESVMLLEEGKKYKLYVGDADEKGIFTFKKWE